MAYQRGHYRAAYDLYRSLIALREPIPAGHFEATRQRLREQYQRRLANDGLDALLQLAAAGDYRQAELELAAFKPLREHLSKNRRPELERLEAEIAAALGKKPELTDRQKKAEAQRLFDEGKAAYEQGDYPLAKGNLEAALAYAVSIGRWDDVSLRRTLDQVTSELEWGRQKLRDAVRLYELEDYGAAGRALAEINSKGIDYGPEVDQGLARYLGDIDARARAKQLADAIEQARIGEELAADRRKIVEEWRRRDRLRRRAAAHRAEGDRARKDGRFEQARGEYEAALKVLDDAREAGEKGVAEIRREVERDLARLQEQTLAAGLLRQKQAKLEGMFVEAARLAQSDPAAADAKLTEALDFQRAESLKLGAAERAVKADLEREFDRRYGQQLRRYEELLRHSEQYRDLHEWGREAALLEIVREARGIPGSALLLGEVPGRLRAAGQNLQGRAEIIATLNEVARQADDLLKAGRPAEGLARYAEVLRFDQQGQLVIMTGPNQDPMPTEAIAGILRNYWDFANVAFPGLAAARLADAKKQADSSIGEARAGREHWLASFYLVHASPDAAKPLLESLADSEGADPEHVKWAKKRLETIDADIAALERRELLASAEQVAAIAEMEVRFRDCVGQGDRQAAEALNAQIEDARAGLLTFRARHALQRGAYPVAHELLKDVPDDRVPEELAEQVSAWERQQGLLARAEQALLDVDSAGAAEALAQMQQTEPALEPDPFSEPREMLKTALDGVRTWEQEALTAEKDVRQCLGTVRGALVEALARQKAWDIYRQTLSHYAAGRLEEAAEVAEKLQPAREGLRPFEQAQLDYVIEACRPAPGPAAAKAAGQDSPAALEQIAAMVEARDFIGAAGLLDNLAKTDAYGRDEAVQARAGELRQKVDAAEEQAARLCAEIVTAHEAGDNARVQTLVGELKTQYAKTRVFEEYW